MNRFNLTFRGEIIEGHDPEQARARLARLLAIDDPAKLQRLFCGDPVVLRRNMERKEAAGLYARLRAMGIQAELVKILERGGPHKDEKPPATPPSGTEEKASEAIHKADLAAKKFLLSEEKAQLKARENALKKALKAKQQEAAIHNRASARAREKALAREAAHNARLETARQKAELAEKKRKAEADAAEREAQLQRQQAEAAAKHQAELELAQAREEARQAAERAERKRVETAERERLKAEQAERARRAAQERARIEAARAEQARLAAEEHKRVEAAQAEQARLEAEERKRLAAEKAAQREQEKRKAEQLAARLQVENARRKREQAEAAARRKAEEARKKARELAQQQAEQEERLAQRREMEEQAIQRAAVELAQKPALKPMDARVRTRLETPSRQRHHGAVATEGRRKRQPGAPNLYSLRPFRNSPEIRARAEQSHRIMRLAFTAAAIALAAALALGARLLSLPPPAIITGASAIAIVPQGGPLLLAGDHLLLHDRAGVGVSAVSLDSLGLTTLHGPLAFDAQGQLLAPGLLSGPGEDASENGTTPLLHCLLAELHCEQFSQALAGTAISALAVHPLDGSLYIADRNAGQLLKVSTEGVLLARAAAAIPPAPVLRLDSGLLMMNSALGSAISVFRYEDEAFGQQLDEVLLLPPTTGGGEFTRVRDFLWSGEHWWVLLDQTGSDNASLYRFDGQWQFVDQPGLQPASRPSQLVNWGNRILVADPSHLAVQRFNSAGALEAPLVSDALTELADKQAHRASLALLAWRIGLVLCLLATAACACTGALHRIRGLVYKSCRERGAEPIDKLADTIEWIEIAPERAGSLARTGIGYAVLATGLVLGAIGLGVSSLQLSALLLALAGPAVALLLLQRSDPGHIGTLGSELLLVDHDGMYHLGGGARIHCRGPFLMIDDVTVFTGTWLLPAFSPAGIKQTVAPAAAEGIGVDSKIVTVKLLQSRHPLALGALAILAAGAAAVALLSLQGIF